MPSFFVQPQFTVNFKEDTIVKNNVKANQYLIDTFAQWNQGNITAAVITLGGSGLTSNKVSDMKFTTPSLGESSAVKLLSIGSGDGIGKHLKLNGIHLKFNGNFVPSAKYLEFQFYTGDINSGNPLGDEFRFIYKRTDVGDNTILWLNNLEAKTWLVQHAGRVITMVMTPATDATYIDISQTSLDKSVQWNYSGIAPYRCPNPTFPLTIGDDILKMNPIDENTVSQLFYYTYNSSADYIETSSV